MSTDYTIHSLRKGKHLTQNERELIERWKNHEKLSHREIARRLGKSPQTINNEIKRGLVDLTFSNGTFDYSSQVAQDNYDLMRSAVGKTDTWTPEKADFIKENIQQKYSLEVIASHDNMPCFSTLYSWVAKGWIPGITSSDLIYPRKAKKETPKYINRKPRKADCLSIDVRPEVINNREETGHFEIDLVILNKSKGKQLLTLVDRKTRYSIVRIVKDKTIESINHVMSELNKTYHFKSITADNGSEFLGLDDVLDCPIYYAHPYASYERGSNENVNRMIRRHIPKGTQEASEDSVNKIEEWLNHYPRKLFNFQSPLEHEEVSQLFNSVA